MKVTGIHHLTLTVSDADASAAWYQRLLGPAEVVRREAPGWRRVRMAWPTGIVIGVTAHDGTPVGDRFDHVRTGLDHVGIGCPSEADVRAWAAHLDDLGVTHGPVEDVPYAWAVTARDPDGIPVEFFCAKPA
jgi:glyoxylase I family protein